MARADLQIGAALSPIPSQHVVVQELAGLLLEHEYLPFHRVVLRNVPTPASGPSGIR